MLSWAVFLVDHCAAIGWDRPPVLDHRDIITPLPRAWADYEMVRCSRSLPPTFLDIHYALVLSCFAKSSSHFSAVRLVLGCA